MKYKSILKKISLLAISIIYLGCNNPESSRVYYYREDERRTGFTQDSSLRYQPNRVSSIDMVSQIYITPLIDRDNLYVTGVDRYFFAYNNSTHNLNWRYRANGIVSAPPVSYKRLVMIPDSQGNLTALDRKNGVFRWRFSEEGSIYSSPVLQNDVLHFGMTNGYYYRLKVSDGSLISKIRLSDSIFSSPAMSGAYIVFYTEKGNVICLNSGLNRPEKIYEPLWTFSINDSDYLNYTNPVISGNKVFVTSRSGTVYSLDLLSGNVIWTYKAGNMVDVSPAIYNNLLIFGCYDKKVYALDIANGREVWVLETDSEITSPALVSSSMVYIGMKNGKLLAINLRDGRLLWSYQTRDSIVASPVLYNGRLYVASYDYSLYIME